MRSRKSWPDSDTCMLSIKSRWRRLAAFTDHLYLGRSIVVHQERKTLMDQLKVLEREDRALRQKAIATIPVSDTRNSWL